MAILRLELDIDSDVYPELYARLVTMLAPGARSERVRQLAASGLVWETLRIEGHAPPIARGPAGLQTQARPAVPPAAAACPASRARSAHPAQPGFVDLAIDARPAAPSLDRVAPGDVHGATEAMAARLPVLTDVLEPAAAAPVREDADDAEGASPPEMRQVQPLWPSGIKRAPGTRSRLMRMKERGLFKNG
jgi:hypothetical protein